MPNKNYNTGRDKEYDVINVLKNKWNYDPHTTRRSAGSHSDIDVEGYHLEMRQIFVAQVKKHEGLIDLACTERLRSLYGQWTVLPYDVWGHAKNEPFSLHFERLFEV